MQVLIFCELRLKTHIHDPKIFSWRKGAKYGKEWCDVDPNGLVLTFGSSYLCTNFDENRSTNASVRKAFADFVHLPPKWLSNELVNARL